MACAGTARGRQGRLWDVQLGEFLCIIASCKGAANALALLLLCTGRAQETLPGWVSPFNTSWGDFLTGSGALEPCDAVTTGGELTLSGTLPRFGGLVSGPAGDRTVGPLMPEMHAGGHSFLNFSLLKSLDFRKGTY